MLYNAASGEKIKNRAGGRVELRNRDNWKLVYPNFANSGKNLRIGSLESSSLARYFWPFARYELVERKVLIENYADSSDVSYQQPFTMSTILGSSKAMEKEISEYLASGKNSLRIEVSGEGPDILVTIAKIDSIARDELSVFLVQCLAMESDNLGRVVRDFKAGSVFPDDLFWHFLNDQVEKAHGGGGRGEKHIKIAEALVERRLMDGVLAPEEIRRHAIEPFKEEYGEQCTRRPETVYAKHWGILLALSREEKELLEEVHKRIEQYVTNTTHALLYMGQCDLMDVLSNETLYSYFQGNARWMSRATKRFEGLRAGVQSEEAQDLLSDVRRDGE